MSHNGQAQFKKQMLQDFQSVCNHLDISYSKIYTIFHCYHFLLYIIIAVVVLFAEFIVI